MVESRRVKYTRMIGISTASDQFEDV
jgi:hypothetical protein